MRTLAGPLAALMASGRATWKADLWTFVLVTEQTLRFTSADRDLYWNGHNYLAGPRIDRGRVRWSMGLEVGSLEFEITPRAADLLGSQPLGHALTAGAFDGAAVRLDRAYGAVPGTITGAIEAWFTGRCAPLRGDGLTWTGVAKDWRELLDQPFPRNVVQPQCSNTLYDSMCGVLRSNHRSTGTVAGSIAATRTAFDTSLAQATDTFTYGMFRWTSGANDGLSQQVRSHANSGGRLTFPAPWPFQIVAGDAFEVWKGCDKAMATCNTKFSNLARFRGQPFVPAAETTT